MINAKCKMLYDEYATQLEVKVNQFLQTIDIRWQKIFVPCLVLSIIFSTFVSTNIKI